ncbi:predicted protein [Uncinocarpus reesii 1704]|uniref:Protein Zds1 C-terminal domain-containing protein n=1 Tax=Uncinocarpus reesii (strain UAMH 1704) TaxID=336963 RepID=C4JGJ1_UNCRE|nr:uncharacterized protein UREG_01182 [Uncinocarpus reesii 1704]EEP76333.1 predicted protein [Uncinocarpus reesii 1704]
MDFSLRQQTSIASYDRENGRDTSRQRHVPPLSIRDGSHHVTETISQMYEDDYDRRNSNRLSFVATQQDETISTTPIARNNADSRTSPHRLQHLPIRTGSFDKQRPNGQQGSPRESGGQRNNGELSPGLSRAAATETTTTAFEVNDLDYGSNPAAVAQELNNLAALRRMSMDVGAIDPDLPSFGSGFSMPSIAPSPSAGEDDTSRLFWVPARLHPGIAPKEFKTFLESKAEQIKRRSGELSFLDPSLGMQQGAGGELRRKKSMLSRQVDSSSISSSRSDSIRSAPASSLQALAEEASSSALSNHFADDKPILPLAPPGHSLRRSTRTTYRKGSLRAGERVPRRFPRQSDPNSDAALRRSPPPLEETPILGLTRVSTDPTPVLNSPTSSSRLAPHRSLTPGDSSDAGRESRQERPNLGLRTISTHASTPHTPSTPRSILKDSPTHIQHDNIHSADAISPIQPQQHFIPERKSSHGAPPSLPPQMPLPPEPTTARPRKTSSKQGKEIPLALKIASHLPPLSEGMRTDCLRVVTSIAEDKKPEKKTKEKKDPEGGRKSSWHWRRSTEDKDKDKKKDDEGKKHKSKSSRSGDKMHDNTRLDVLQTSIDGVKPRESVIIDRSGDDDRRNKKADNYEFKKEKESGLFSSIFGSKKKANPRRALYSQVLLSNFMYSYLAKVQQMHPHMSLPTSPAQNQQRKKELHQQQQQQQEQADEYSQYQEYQQGQEHDQYGESVSYVDDERMYYDMEGNGAHNHSTNHDPGNEWVPRHNQRTTSNENDDDDDMW